MLTIDDVLLALLYVLAACAFCTIVHYCVAEEECDPEELSLVDESSSSEGLVDKAL